MHISFTIDGFESLNSIISKKVKEYASDIAKDLVAFAERQIRNNYQQAIYTGTNDTKVSSKMLSKYSGEILAQGSTALFIEFGTGVSFNGSAGSSPHEWASRTTPPSLIGSYGYGKGKQNHWAFYGSNIGNDTNSFVIVNKGKGKSSGKSVVITKGISAQYPIYNGYKEMKLRSQTKYGCKQK